MSERITLARWRVGRKLGRTIYVMTGNDRDEDELIGIMDSAEVANYIVIIHNALILGALSD